MYGGVVVRRIGMTCSKTASSSLSSQSGWMDHIIQRRAISSTVQAHPPTYETLTAVERSKIDGYLDLLLDWNTRMNLTGINDRGEAIERHINDSLSLLPSLDECMQDTKDPRVLDVGSGAGLPGLVIATVRPEWNITLLDSLNKRCTFNTAAADTMGLDNVHIVWSRAEDAGRDPHHREAYSIVTARAVAELRVLGELCLPFVRVGGYWIAPKGTSPDEEIQNALVAIEKLGGCVESLDVQRVESSVTITPGDDSQTKRTVVIVKKTRKTIDTYPRKPGVPKKKPL